MHCAQKLHSLRKVTQSKKCKMYSERTQILLILIVTCFVAATWSEQTANAGCEVPISSKRHYLYQWPLVFQPNGELYATTKNEHGEVKVQVADGAQVLLSCGPNYLKQYQRKEVLNVRCHGASQNFSVVADGEKAVQDSAVEKSIKEYACDLRVIEEVLSPVHSCNNDKWTATNFGYVDPTTQLTHLLGEACYDTHAGRTIFVHIKLGADSLKKTDKDYLTSRQHPDGRYKIELFRGLHFDEIYANIRTQLHSRSAPHLKLANYIDDALLSNTQYQAVKKLSWNYFVAMDELQVLDALKNDIKLRSAQNDLDVYVGSHGVKTLQGTKGEQMKLYLQQAVQRFPAPELIWIVVRQQQQAIAFVVPNDKQNALQATTTQAPALCTSKCEQITWLSASLREVGSGILCCSFEEFKGAIKEVPQLVPVNAMLL